MEFKFSKPLIEGIIIKRTCQFIMWAKINGVEQKVHSPVTSRIGNVALENVACLVSDHGVGERKTRYTVEAISVDPIEKQSKTWIGINQIFSNELFAATVQSGELKNIFGEYGAIKREVKVGEAKLDFKIDDTFVEVKTPLIIINKIIDSSIKLRTFKSFSSTARLEKHLAALSSELKSGIKCKLFIIFQYEIDDFHDYLESMKIEQVRNLMSDALQNGLEVFALQYEVNKVGVVLKDVKNITNEII